MSQSEQSEVQTGLERIRVAEVPIDHHHYIVLSLLNAWMETVAAPMASTIMRADGVRIVVETTASAAPSLGDKAEGWARLLAAHPGVGVIILFLMAQPVDSSRTDLVHRVRRAVAAGVRAHPGAVGDPVSERMVVADWTGWFPEHGMVSEDFFALRALRWHPVRGWGPVDLFLHFF